MGALLLALGLSGAVWAGSSLGPSSEAAGMSGGMMRPSTMESSAGENSMMPKGMMDQCEAMMEAGGEGTMMSGGMMG